MVNDTKAANIDGACEDARKDGDAIRDAFSHKGIEEAYALLKEERKNASNLTPEEKDIWEKEMVNSLSSNGGKTDLLPGLALAFLKENKETYKNPDDSDEYDVRTVSADAKNNFKWREMEDSYAEVNKGSFLNKVDDIDVVLVGNAADMLKKNDFGGKKIREIEDLDEVLEDNKKDAEKQAGFDKTRDLNKSIAETFTKNHGLFSIIDSENDDDETDGQLTQDEVTRFLEHVEKNKDYKDRFSADELKAAEALKTTFEDKNNRDDDSQSLVETRKKSIFHDRKNWITQESILETVGGAEAAKKLVDDAAKPKEENKEVADKDTSEGADKEGDKDGKDKDAENKDEHKDEKVEEKKEEVVDTETKMVNDAVQKAGEGPYQVAARLLGGKGDMAAQIALTKVLKEQLIEDTGAKNYAEAITKLEVGHPFFTCDSLEKIREKVAASGNQSLMDLFGAPTVKQDDTSSEKTNTEKTVAEKTSEEKDAEAKKDQEPWRRQYQWDANYLI